MESKNKAERKGLSFRTVRYERGHYFIREYSPKSLEEQRISRVDAETQKSEGTVC